MRTPAHNEDESHWVASLKIPSMQRLYGVVAQALPRRGRCLTYGKNHILPYVECISCC